MTIIRIPKQHTIFYNTEDNDIWVYEGFSKDINGHVLKQVIGRYVTMIAVCHDEFIANYFKVGEL